ncbi:MAG: alpha/beta fold hydrolase [Actinophytocola sp.]|nr:alpha/beta fold hydrolase [Actinophytocola sp.]
MFTATRVPQPPQERPTMPVGTLPRQQASLSCGTVSYLRHGAGPPLLLVHGIPTSARLWEPLLGTLGRHFDCIVPDLLGMGRSRPAPHADLSSPGQAAMFAELLDALGIDETLLVLHDQGGSHGQQFMVRSPERIRAVAFRRAQDADAEGLPAAADRGARQAARQHDRRLVLRARHR